jgi:hypothetical protein
MTYRSCTLTFSFTVALALACGGTGGSEESGASGSESGTAGTEAGNEEATESMTGDGDGDPTTGDGDGDPTTGDGDGDPTTGDGDGDPTTGDGDGDGDPTTGDGDGDPTTGDGDGDQACGDLDCSECYACAADDPNECADEKAACEDDPDCVDLGACVADCGPVGEPDFEQCHDDCVDGMPGENLFKDLGACLACDVCNCQNHPEC